MHRYIQERTNKPFIPCGSYPQHSYTHQSPTQDDLLEIIGTIHASQRR